MVRSVVYLPEPAGQPRSRDRAAERSDHGAHLHWARGPPSSGSPGSSCARPSARPRASLRHFFEPVIRDIGVMRGWGEAGLLDDGDAAGHEPAARPAAARRSAAVGGDGGGRARAASNIVFPLRRCVEQPADPAATSGGGPLPPGLEWTDGATGSPSPSRRGKRTTTPRRRPWYQGAVLDPLRAPPAGPEPPDLGLLDGRPYAFYAAQGSGK